MSGSLRLLPPSSPIDVAVSLPGSKSFTNRALVLAASADGTTILEAASLSDDSLVLLDGLRALGAELLIEGERVTVTGTGGRWRPYKGRIDVGHAGTSMRFLTSLCVLAEGAEVHLCGSERMHQRPIGDLVAAWQSAGAHIQYEGEEGCPPLLIKGRSLPPQEGGYTLSMPGQISSQFMTSLLLCGPQFPGSLTLQVEGDQISTSYIDMTFDMMRLFGLKVENHSYRSYHVPAGQAPKPGRYTIEGDASGGSYFWGLAAISGGRVRVHNANPDSCQGDIHFPTLLAKMGCEVQQGETEGVPWIEVKGGPLTGVSVDMSDMPDTAMTLAVIASCAQGQTTITGLSTLRHKETDRLQAMQVELAKVGIKSEITDESITVTGGQPTAGSICTYDDHRMAMAFSLLGVVTEGIVIQDPGVVSKSFPDFWKRLAVAGVRGVSL